MILRCSCIWCQSGSLLPDMCGCIAEMIFPTIHASSSDISILRVFRPSLKVNRNTPSPCSALIFLPFFKSASQNTNGEQVDPGQPPPVSCLAGRFGFDGDFLAVIVLGCFVVAVSELGVLRKKLRQVGLHLFVASPGASVAFRSKSAFDRCRRKIDPTQAGFHVSRSI